jgi:hypothetical protein
MMLRNALNDTRPAWDRTDTSTDTPTPVRPCAPILTRDAWDEATDATDETLSFCTGDRLFD